MTVLTAPPGTRSVLAIQLEIGDTLVKDDGSYDSMVEDVFTDDYGTWLDTGDTIGYVSPIQHFLIEDWSDR